MPEFLTVSPIRTRDINSSSNQLYLKMKRQYLWAVFILGFFLLNYPVFQLYNIGVSILGIPTLYFFVFLFLGISAGLTFWVIRKSKKEGDAQ